MAAFFSMSSFISFLPQRGINVYICIPKSDFYVQINQLSATIEQQLDVPLSNLSGVITKKKHAFSPLSGLEKNY